MDLNAILPKQILFSLSELQSIGLLKANTAKKLIIQGKISAVKVGVKIFIPRNEVVRYFDESAVKV